MTPEIQNQIDYMVSKFQDSIQKFEALVQANKDLSKENADLKASVGNLGSKFDSLVIDFGSFIVAHSESVKAQSKVNEHFDKMHMNQTSINGVLRADIENVVSECSKAKDKIELIFKMIDTLSAKIDTLDAKYNKIPDQFAKLNDPVNFCQTELAKLADGLLKGELSIKNIQTFMDKNSLNFVALTTDLNKLGRRHENLINELQKNQVYFQEAIPKVIDQKIAEIPKPVIPSLEEAKKAFQNQLEPVSLDAKNSVLRSVNTDSKLHILEKKIEQLKLILDQITIGK